MKRAGNGTRRRKHLLLFFLAALTGAHAGTAPSNQQALVAGADLPHYPIIAEAAGVTGRLWVRAIVKEGKVKQTELIKAKVRNRQHVLLSQPYLLAVPTLENLKSWRFADWVTQDILVTYTYRIAGTETTGPTNPAVVISPSLDVMITARPVKATVTY